VIVARIGEQEDTDGPQRSHEDVARAGIIVRAKGLLPFRIENPVRPDGHNKRKCQAQDSDEFAESQIGNNQYIVGIGCQLWDIRWDLSHRARDCFLPFLAPAATA